MTDDVPTVKHNWIMTVSRIKKSVMWCAYYNPINVDEDEIYKVDKKVDKNKAGWQGFNLSPLEDDRRYYSFTTPYNRITLKDAHHCSTDTTWRCETYCIKIFGSAIFDDEAEACRFRGHHTSYFITHVPSITLSYQDVTYHIHGSNRMILVVADMDWYIISNFDLVATDLAFTILLP